MRGDTDFSQTAHLDRWDDQPDVGFLFGVDASMMLKLKAESLGKSEWKPLVRPARYDVATEERAKPINAKEQVVDERCFQNLNFAASMWPRSSTSRASVIARIG